MDTAVIQISKFWKREEHIVDNRVIQVDPSRLPCLSQWKRENTMETILIELRRYSLSSLLRRPV